MVSLETGSGSACAGAGGGGEQEKGSWDPGQPDPGVGARAGVSEQVIGWESTVSSGGSAVSVQQRRTGDRAGGQGTGRGGQQDAGIARSQRLPGRWRLRPPG